MVCLPQLGDVRGKAKKVKEEKLKLPYGALQTKSQTKEIQILYTSERKTKDCQVISCEVLLTRGSNCDKGRGSAALVQQHVRDYEVWSVTGCPSDKGAAYSYLVPSWAF